MNLPVISPQVMAVIVDLINSISHGTVTFIVQDSRLLQLERNDKIRLDLLGKTTEKTALLTSGQIERLRKRLQVELKGLQFGQIILHIKGGMILQIERTEKQRYSSMEGIYGDGI